MRNISNHINTVIQGDCLKELKTFPDSCIDCVITSPPYWQLRDYGWKDQWGLEKTYHAYLENLWSLMNEIYRVLKPQGTVWINIGDTYFGSGNGSSKKEGSKREINQYKNSEVYPTKANDDKSNGLKKKTLSLIPHRFAIGCLERGWIIRNDIIWAKPNSLPESSKDRFGKKHEHIFFMTKSPKYFFDLDAIRDPYKESSKQRAIYEVTSFKGDDVKKVPVGKSKKSGSKQSKIALNPLGKNPGDVTDFWSISNKHGSDKHYAVFNSELILKPVLAGCPKGGIILDPFCGTATTGVTAIANGRNFIGIEGNKEYVKISQRNLKNVLADNKIESLDGRMTSTEVADYLNKQADVLQKYIDAKLNPAIASQNPTARRMKIKSKMREDALEMERLQTILRTLAKAHSSNNIVRFPHLEDIRNKKQIQSLLQLEYLKKYNRDIDWYIDNDKDTLERMSIFSKHDWENAYKQLEDLQKEFSDVKENNKQIEAENTIEHLELEALAELELLKMELESKKSKKGLSGKQKSNAYPMESEFLLGNVNENTKKKKASTNKDVIKNVPEVKLTFRKNENFPTAKIVKSEDAVDFIRKLFEKDTIQLQEQFMVLYLNRSNHVIGYHLLSKGGIAGTVADLRLVFSAAILSLSSAIILSHNHPSGNLKPSDADIKLTRRFKETGVIMEIPVLDSIILTEESFYSFADDGMI